MNAGVPIVLLIEHDPIQSVTLVRMLKDGGYRVIPARRAHDALETFVTHHMDIALVVADTQCTTFAGPPLLGALHMIDSRVPVVAMSPGAANEPCAEEYPNVVATLTKPFAPADLLAHMQRALQSPVSQDQHAYRVARGTVVDPRWVAGPVPSLGDQAFGYGGVPFSWPPAEDDLDDIQVVDTQASDPPEALRPSKRLLKLQPAASTASAVAPVEIDRWVQAVPPIRLVASRSEPRRRWLRFMRTDRWIAVAATALGGLTLTTLLELRGVPLKRAGLGESAPAAAVAPVLSARNHHIGAMRLVPAKRVTSRIDARIDSYTRLPRPATRLASTSVPVRVTRTAAPAPAAVIAAGDRGRRDRTPQVSEIETRTGTRTANAAALPLALAAPRPPASPAPSSASPSPSVESAPARGDAAVSTNARSATGAPPPVGRPREDERGIYQVLQQYERAYERLDVNAARAVWPSLNTRALARAFDGLKEQALEFSHCRVALESQSREATAICGGRASYVPRVGHQTARTEPREWTFRLQKVDHEWLIAKAEVR